MASFVQYGIFFANDSLIKVTPILFLTKWFFMNNAKGIQKEDRQDHGQQNETKDKHRAHNITLKTKAGVTRTLQKPV